MTLAPHIMRRDALWQPLALLCLLLALVSPSGAAAAPCTTPGSSEDSSIALQTFRDDLLTLINNERAQQGLSLLGASCALECIAQWHTEDMIALNFFAHENKVHQAPWDRYQRATGQRVYCSENIAGGHADAQDVFEGWMNSPGHRANMLDPQARWAGVGAMRATPKYRIPQGWIVTLNLSQSNASLTARAARDCPCATGSTSTPASH